MTDSVLQMTVFHNVDDRASVPVDNVVLMYVGFQMTCIQRAEFECYPRSWCLPPSCSVELFWKKWYGRTERSSW